MKNHPYSINTSKSQVIQNLLSERDTLEDTISSLKQDLSFERELSGRRHKTAQELITKNQTLKAKAELLDEAIIELNSYCKDNCLQNPSGFQLPNCEGCSRGKLLMRAKELDK